MVRQTIAELERRLEVGWQVCEAETDHNRRAELERHWIALLKRYEAAVDLERRRRDRLEAA